MASHGRLSCLKPQSLSWGQFSVMASLMAALASIGAVIMACALDTSMSGMPIWIGVFLYVLGPIVIAISAFGTYVFWRY